MQTEVVSLPLTNRLPDGTAPMETEPQRKAILVASPKEYEVRRVERKDIKEFMETWHYSHSINGLSCRYCFGLYYDDVLIGAMIYGKMAMHGQALKYVDADIMEHYKSGKIALGEAEDTILELRRLACIDDTVRNTESSFIGRTLKWLKRNAPDVRRVISYSDEYYGHRGIIYQASNFEHLGYTSPGRVIVWKHENEEGETVEERYHDHAIRTKYKGRLKSFALTLRTALEEGEARYERTPGKDIYSYRLHDTPKSAAV